MDKELSQNLSKLAEIFIGLDFAKNQALILSFLIAEKRGTVTFQRIISELGMSKASVSAALHALEEKKFIIYLRQEGSRERQILLQLYGIVDYLTERMRVLQGMRVLFEEAAVWHKDAPAYAQAFSDVAALYTRLDQAVMSIVEEFKEGISDEKE